MIILRHPDPEPQSLLPNVFPRFRPTLLGSPISELDQLICHLRSGSVQLTPIVRSVCSEHYLKFTVSDLPADRLNPNADRGDYLAISHVNICASLSSCGAIPSISFLFPFSLPAIADP